MSEIQTLGSLRASLPIDRREPASLDIETIYAIRRPQVIRFLVKLGVDAIEAEDITQEAFLNAFKPTEGGKSPDHLFRWLLVCARNIAINRYWRGKREVQAPASVWKEWEETIPDAAPGVDINFQEQERIDRYLRALAQLTVTEQRAVLFRGQGRTFREIAAALDVPLRSAIYITSLAIQKLQRKLRDA